MFALPFFVFATVLFVRIHGIVREVPADETAQSGHLPYQDWYVNPTRERIIGIGPEDLTLIDQCVDDVKDRVNGSEPAALFAAIPADSSLGLNWTDWFKARVAAKGGRIDDGKWAATNLLYKNQKVVSATIPETLRPGEYAVHHETIALHQATSYPGVEVYGNNFPTDHPIVSVPGAHKPKRAGIVYGMHTITVSSDYPSPVPRAWTS